MDIPKPLIEQIELGQVVLFLGAGGSYEAVHPEGKKIPLGTDLGHMLIDKFLPAKYKDKNYPLAQIAELAISETDLFQVQEFIADALMLFSPNDFHKLIPLFTWKAVATTNYDLVIERAYEEVKTKVQKLVPFTKNGDKIDIKLSSQDDVPYYKLHGSITSVNDIELPLILTPEQYITHEKNRSRLFERLKELSYDYSILFVGYGLADQNIRTIIFKVFSEMGDAIPRSYLIDPLLEPEQMRMWEAKGIASFPISFKDFLNKLNTEIPPRKRVLTRFVSDLSPIQRRFVSNDVTPSESLLDLLNRDVDYLHSAFKMELIDPKLFYQGYFEGWSAIERRLDAKRDFSDAILSEVFLVEEEEKFEKQELVVLRGHAGSGKSVLLKRVAWDAATVFDKLCLFVKPSAIPAYEPIKELFSLCRQRIYLFIESGVDHIELIRQILSKAKRDKLPVTILTTARTNEWNVFGEPLQTFETRRYNIKYLREHEIDNLIGLLEQHKCLGHLEQLSLEERKMALSEKAGRQLLVALHEATLGKPFQDIVADEFNNIPSRQAKNLYLSVCVLHRLGVVTRAGVISRLHGIPFGEFKEKLFKPLEQVVFARKHPIFNDYQYVTRHPYIAEMVFEEILVDQDDRFHEYAQMLALLDIDYNADRDAFIQMTKSKHLRNSFQSLDKIRDIFEIAKKRAPKDPYLLQQEAIFEMSIDDGDLEKASNLLLKAHQFAPYSDSISHSLAELSLSKAAKSNSVLEKTKLRSESRELAQKIIQHNDKSSHAYHTVIKSYLNELEEILKEQPNPKQLEDLTRTIGQNLSSALQEFPDESFLLDADSRFSQLIKTNSQALESLKKAFQNNKKSSYIALRLANMYLDANEQTSTVEVLKTAIDNNPNDKDLNFKLATVLKEQNALPAEIKHYLRASFTKGDTRFIAQFWYARLLYLEGDFEQANEIFNELKNAGVDVRTKRKPRGKILRGDKAVVFNGTVKKVEAGYAFIQRDIIEDRIFVYRYNEGTCSKGFIWEEMETNSRVSFEIGFTYYGPIALNISEENLARFSAT